MMKTIKFTHPKMPRHIDLMHAFCIVMLMMAALFNAPARAQVTLDITRPTVEAIPIAIPHFQSENAQFNETGQNISETIADNLKRSGFFKTLDPRSFVQSNIRAGERPRFADWRVINANLVVSGLIRQQPDGRLRVEFRLWDALTEKEMVGVGYQTAPNNWRRIAHMISDEIYGRVTGERGYFNSRIVYVAESGPQGNRMKRLAIMDQDGENHQFLTDGSYLVLTPRFSPTAQEITYLAYIGDQPRVYLFNINTGRQEVLGDFPGMTFAPRFAPDGNAVIMSQAVHGDTDIFTMDLRNRRILRLTDSMGIDTAPSYAPDGSQIVFESDRSGSQQLYIMGSDGSNQRRLTFGQGGRYANPVWSPRGDLIAFTKMYQGRFFIGVIRPDGTGERLLTEAYHAEGPTWSPNGRVISYFKEIPQGSGSDKRTVKLYTIDITGLNERLAQTPGDASDPAWSPLIK